MAQEEQQDLKNIDIAARSAIVGDLSAIRRTGLNQKPEDLISSILDRRVWGQSSKPGHLHVTGIASAATTMRENLYIAGLSSSKYPGRAKENYLLLDPDFRAFGSGAEFLTSDKQLEHKSSRVLALAELASTAGAHVAVSYPNFNVADLKADNPSSLVYLLYRKEHGANATSKDLDAATHTMAYFDPKVSKTRLVGTAYLNRETIAQTAGVGNTTAPAAPAAIFGKRTLTSAFSPTSLEKFFSCPRRFMLLSLLDLEEPEENDPFEIISPLDKGNIAHAVMEWSADHPDATLDELLAEAEAAFDRFIAQHPALIPEDVDSERDDFLDLMGKAYTMEPVPRRKVVTKEEELSCTHLETGVRLKGFPDRVEKLDDGTCLIVDFKTGKNPEQKEDDVLSCLQVILYAYMLEQQGYTVSGGEYRYLATRDVISCKYDDAAKEILANLLSLFKIHMEDSDFPVSRFAGKPDANRPDPCRYCKFGSICGKDTVIAPEGSDSD